jgi:hypothetical protein
MSAQQAAESREQALASGREAAVAVARRQVELEAEAPVAEELRPADRIRVDLRCRTDGVVPVPAELRLRQPVEAGKLRPQLRLAASAGSVELEILED